MSETTPNTPIDQAGGLEEFFASIRARLESIVNDDSSNLNTQVATDYAPADASGANFALGDPLIVVGTEGDDNPLLGDAGSNIIIARAGGDTLVGFGSFDILLGGAGVDTTDYSYVNVQPGQKGVFVDLGNGLSVTSGGDVDILSSIENVIGTAGDDVLLGSSVSNIFLGNGGNDIIDGRGENDTDVVQLVGNAEDYDYSGKNDDGSIVITNKETGATTTLYNIEFVQFDEGSEGGGVTIFSAEDGSAIAYDETVETTEGDPETDSAITEFTLDATIIGAPGEILVTGVAFGDGEPGGDVDSEGYLTIDGVYGTLKINTVDGSATYTQNEVADALNLDDGKVSDTFTYQVVGGDTAEVTVTIDPVNDAPVLEFKNPGDGILNIEEFDDKTDSTDLQMVQAHIKITDVDTDVSAANFGSSATLIDWDFSQLGNKGDDKVDIPGEISTWISEAETPDTSVDPNEGTLVFKYTVADGELDLLAEGQTLTLTYEVKVWDTTDNADDNEPESATKTVTVIIEGSNDKPVITAEDVTHVVYEDDVHSDDGPDIEANGFLTVEDPDLKEKIDVTIEDASFAYSLADGTEADLPVDQSVIQDLLAATNFAFNGTDDTGSTQGKVKFSFKQDANKPLTFKYSYDSADDVDFLAAGEELVLTFPVTVTDKEGAEDTTEITLTIIGTNDAPTIEAGQEGLSATISEQSDKPAIPGQILSTSGEFEFVDVDVSDINSYEVSGKSFEFHGDNDRVWGSTSNRDEIIETIQNGFQLTGLNEGGPDGVGTVSWSFAAFEGLVDFLAEGEWIDLDFVVKVSDPSGDYAEETVSIRIEGKNDKPIIVEHFEPNTITEFEDLTDASGWGSGHHVSGTMVIYDADNTVTRKGSEAFTVEVGEVTWAYVPGDQIDDPAPGYLFQYLTKTEFLWFDELDEVGRLNYHYSVRDTDLDFLREGETVEITYPVTISDPDGGSVTENIVIKIVGTNDRPVISSVVADPAEFTEDADVVADGEVNGVNDADQALTTSGTITVADADYGDVLTASVSNASVVGSNGVTVPASVVQALTDGNFTFTPADGALNDPDLIKVGPITLDFEFSADVDLDFLGVGETLTLTYDIVITDDSAAHNDTSIPVQLTMTVTGTNDVPVITIGDGDSVMETVAEPAGDEGGTPLEATGTFQVSDEDANDNLSIALKPTYSLGENALTYAQVTALTLALANSNVFSAELENGTVTWTFALNSEDLNFLGEGDTVDVSYTVEVSDGNGGLIEQEIVVKLQGSNDAVEVVEAVAAEDQENENEQGFAQRLETTGTVTVKDLDISDQLSLTVATDATAVLNDGSETLDQAVLDKIDALVDPTFISSTTVDSNGGTAVLEFLYDTGEAGSDVDFLAEGDVLTLTYQAKISDGTAEVLQDIVVKITGSNDQPTVAAEPVVADTGTAFNILDVVGAEDVDHSDVLSVDSISGQLDISLDSLLGSEGVDLSLSLDLLRDAGVITVTPEGDVSFDANFASVLQQVLGEGETVNLSGSLAVTDDSETDNAVSSSADFDLTIDVDANGGPEPTPVIYGTDNAPDFLQAGFEPGDDGSNG